MIERLGPGDGERLRAIRLCALADAPDAFGRTLAESELRPPTDWEAQVVALPPFVWCEGDADLGMIRGASDDGDAEAGYLISLWVAPEARGRGVGAALVEAVVTWARGSGLRCLVFDVGEHNAAARRLYERMGFVATGVMPRTPACVREMEMGVPSMMDDGKAGGAVGSALIVFPEPFRTGAVSLEETLAQRRSLWAFAPEPLSLQSIGQLAWSAQGVTDAAAGYCTAPSAGGMLPVEVDVLIHGVPGLEGGVYRYHPAEHALRLRLAGDRRASVIASMMSQGFVRDAPVVMLVSGVAARIVPRFGALSDRLIDMEVGHVGQNVSLQVVALGLGTVVVVALREAELAAALELGEGERPIYLMPVGRAG